MFKIDHLVVENVLKINELKLNASIVSIEGQSGSGKSTLLRLLNNLDSPKSGSIYYKDKSLMNMDPMELRRKIVMVPDRKSTRLNSSHVAISYAVFCLKKKRELYILKR